MKKQGPPRPGPTYGPRTVGPPYGPKDRGPLVLRAWGGTSGRAAVGRPPSPLAPGPRGSSGQGRALCQTGYSVVCSRGVGPKGTKGPPSPLAPGPRGSSGQGLGPEVRWDPSPWANPSARQATP